MSKTEFDNAHGVSLVVDDGTLYLKDCDTFVFKRNRDSGIFTSTTGVLALLRELYEGKSREDLMQPIFEKIEEAFDGNQDILNTIVDDDLEEYIDTLFDWFSSEATYIKDTAERVYYYMDDYCITTTEDNILVIKKNNETVAIDSINIFKLLHDARYGAVQCVQVVIKELARTDNDCKKLLLRPDLMEIFAEKLLKRTIKVYPREEVNETVEEIAKVKCETPVEVKEITGYGMVMIINGRAVVYNCNNDSYKAIDLQDGSLIMESTPKMEEKLSNSTDTVEARKEYFEDTFRKNGESLAEIVSEHPEQIRVLLEIHDAEYKKRKQSEAKRASTQNSVNNVEVQQGAKNTASSSSTVNKKESSGSSSGSKKKKSKKKGLWGFLEPVLEALVRED